jgi:hypothetical protein
MVTIRKTLKCHPTELINGNYKIANRYIQVLKKTFHYRKWAAKHEKMVRDPSLISSDPELGKKIRMLPESDFFIGSNNIQNIDLLLKYSPKNRTAFEYKLARIMLEKDFMAAVNEVGKMKEMGYGSIPRHIEEAVLAFIYFTREVPDLGGLLVRQEVEQRFMLYLEKYKAGRGDKTLIEKEMSRAEETTFWFYLQLVTVSSEFWESKPVDNTVYGS